MRRPRPCERGALYSVDAAPQAASAHFGATMHGNAAKQAVCVRRADPEHAREVSVDKWGTSRIEDSACKKILVVLDAARP
jgi:hypothetical protein